MNEPEKRYKKKTTTEWNEEAIEMANPGPPQTGIIATLCLALKCKSSYYFYQFLGSKLSIVAFRPKWKFNYDSIERNTVLLWDKITNLI